MLLIAALLLIVIIVTVVIVKNKVEDVPVEGVSVTDVTVDIPVDVIDVEKGFVTGDEGLLNLEVLYQWETLYQNQRLSQRVERKSSKEEGLKVKAIKPRSQGQKTYVSWPSVVIIIEEETEEELLARKFDKQFYGRRASKRKANYWDLKPVGRRPRDGKEKGDFRIDGRLKASRQKKVIESRT